MTFFRFGFGYGIPNTACLDAEFDEPDDAADRELCQAIVVGKAGLHPDGWGNHNPTVMPLAHRRRVHWSLQPADTEELPRPLKPPKRAPRYPPLPPIDWAAPRPQQEGELQLTCDACGRRYRHTLPYSDGQRPVAVAAIRQLAAYVGWTCVRGHDRCPRCTTILQAAAPEAVGDGAGEGEGHE